MWHADGGQAGDHDMIRRLTFTVAAGISLILWLMSVLAARLGGAHSGIEIGPFLMYPAPGWLMAVAKAGPIGFAVLPVLWWVRQLLGERRGARPGTCSKCDYDLL
jgi:hypothetical protein